MLAQKLIPGPVFVEKALRHGKSLVKYQDKRKKGVFISGKGDAPTRHLSPLWG